MSIELSEEQIRRCHAKAKANNSSPEQELFLARGGTLRQWYWSAAVRDRDVSERTPRQVIEARMRAISYRMCDELMHVLGRPLRHREILSLCYAAHVIAIEVDPWDRLALERKTIDRAFEMVNCGR